MYSFFVTKYYYTKSYSSDKDLMRPVILPLWGPFAIHSYGFFIAIGVLIFLAALYRDKRFYALNLGEQFNTIFVIGLLCAVIGGRVLFVLRNYDLYDSWIEWFAFWQPGYAVLGSIIGVLAVVPLYLRKYHIPVLPFFDLIATYAPLMQSVSRIGCFFAGCCYGCPTATLWAVTYTDIASMAPLHKAMHPTQLYSALFLFGIFCIMYYYVRKRFVIPGQQLSCYLAFVGLERLIVDWWRGDREIIIDLPWIALSFYQIIAIVLIMLAMGMCISFTLRHKNSL
jgi:phosphatidylglycerol:prolipoprotein diacylglycerol transferase